MRKTMFVLGFILALLLGLALSPESWGLKGDWIITVAYINVWLAVMFWLAYSTLSEATDSEKEEKDYIKPQRHALNAATAMMWLVAISLLAYAFEWLPEKLSDAPGLFPLLASLTLIIMFIFFIVIRLIYLDNLRAVLKASSGGLRSEAGDMFGHSPQASFPPASSPYEDEPPQNMGKVEKFIVNHILKDGEEE